MNYLAHLYLADHTDTSAAGNVLGDSVKGRLCGEYPPDIELGIHLHRRIDTYTDSHPVVLAACARFEPPYRRYAGILLDIYFDHLLARHWSAYSDEPLSAFTRRMSQTIWQEWPHPPLQQARVSRFHEILEAYASEDGVTWALARVGERAKRDNCMADALPILQAHHTMLTRDFVSFFSDLIAFVTSEAPRLKALQGQ